MRANGVMCFSLLISTFLAQCLSIFTKDNTRTLPDRENRCVSRPNGYPLDDPKTLHYPKKPNTTNHPMTTTHSNQALPTLPYPTSC